MRDRLGFLLIAAALALLAEQAIACDVLVNDDGTWEWLAGCEDPRYELDIGYIARNYERFDGGVRRISEFSEYLDGAILPDFETIEIEHFLAGSGVELQVTIRNWARGSSDVLTISGTTIVTDDSGETSTQTMQIDFAALHSFSQRTFVLGTVHLDDPTKNNDLLTEIVLDTDDSIVESDETNNTHREPLCRILGVNPDYSVRQCNR